MKILWFTWKDKKNPQAGGAELINEELAKRLVRDNHQVRFLVAGFRQAKNQESKNGFRIIRVGNKFTVYWQAYRYFKKNLKNWPDLIIEEINTIPFFTQLYTSQKKILLLYQLCREIWFYQFTFPFNIIGFLLEPLYLRLLSKNRVITESHSTRQDLKKNGFKSKNLFIFPVGINFLPSNNTSKFSNFTLLSFGTIRPMKRTDHQIMAFEKAKQQIPDLKLIICGDAGGNYGLKIKQMISKSAYSSDIIYYSRTTEKEKFRLMKMCHLLLVTSVKEGWGLVVTEANSQGTPAVVYNVDGLRDSVKQGKTGLVCKLNNPHEIAKNIVLLFQNKSLYQSLKKNAIKYSRNFTFTNSYQEFKKYAEIS